MKLSPEATSELIKTAFVNQQVFEIIYLNATNEKSTRHITPTYIGLMKYQNTPYMGIKAFCHTSQKDKVFRMDRIMEIKTITEHEELACAS